MWSSTLELCFMLEFHNLTDRLLDLLDWIAQIIFKIFLSAANKAISQSKMLPGKPQFIEEMDIFRDQMRVLGIANDAHSSQTYASPL